MIQKVFQKPGALYAYAGLLLLLSLGSKPLWSQEGRWGVICREMVLSGDYLHPVLLGEPYEDKPLGSYWLMMGAARLGGGISEWTLRLPSALAGILTVWCLTRIGRILFSRELGILAGWLLTTTFFFVFWSRVSSADMLNVAAVTGGLAWYVERRTRPGFATWSVFGIILAVGSLMKGLIAPVLAIIAVAPDLLTERRWRFHLTWSLVPAAAIALLVYVFPFYLSGATGESQGLRMVVQENIVRYFNAFDHREPWYFYLYQLPIYLLPWTFLQPVSIYRGIKEWKALSPDSRWMFWAGGLMFLFLQCSGSRRNYYLLPLVPITVLIIAGWLRSQGDDARRIIVAQRAILCCATPLVLWFGIIQPHLATLGGSWVFRDEVRQEAERIAPWTSWELLCCSAPPDSVYYLSPSGRAGRRLGMDELDNVATFLKTHPRTIVVTYGRFYKDLSPLISKPVTIAQRPMFPSWLLRFAPQTPNLVAIIQSGPKE